MQIVNPQIISGKKVLLRYDIDVVLHPLEDFKLKAGLSTLKLCLENAKQVIMMGHIGRPNGRIVPQLSVEPIRQWFKIQGLSSHLTSGKLKLLENLRFDPREEACDLKYAKELALMGETYVNEAFSSYRPASSTTVLPTLLPHAAGLHFTEEVRVLRRVRENPKKPFVAIMGGAKVEDKLPVIKALAFKADVVLVGGKLVHEIRDQRISLSTSVMVGKLNEDGFDISPDTTQSWRHLIMGGKMIVWNGPLGKYEDPKNDQTKKVAQIVIDSGAESIVGGGDTVAALNKAGLLDKISFVSVGGGAMLKFLADGTLPTIEVLS